MKTNINILRLDQDQLQKIQVQGFPFEIEPASLDQSSNRLSYTKAVAVSQPSRML